MYPSSTALLNASLPICLCFKLDSQIEENKKLQEKAVQLQEEALLAAQEKVVVQETVEVEEAPTSLEAEFEFSPDIEGDRSEEDRQTEAEKNERQRLMLHVWMSSFELNHDQRLTFYLFTFMCILC